MGTRAVKKILRAESGKYKFGGGAGKYKLRDGASKYNLKAWARGQETQIPFKVTGI